MNSIVIACFVVLALASTATGLSCIVCDSVSNSGCGTNYVSGSGTSMSGYGSCGKTVYSATYGSIASGTVARGGFSSSSPCVATSTSYATLYCCSDKDNCNGAMGNAASIFLAVTLLMGAFYAKQSMLA